MLRADNQRDAVGASFPRESNMSPAPLRGREKKPAAGAQSLDFELLFRSAPSLLLVLDTDYDFTILEASDAYLRALRVARETVIGRGFFDVFPEKADGSAGAASSRAALERVVETRIGDGFNAPILDAGGRLRYVIHRLDAMEPEVLRRARERDEAVHELERANAELDVFVTATSQGLHSSLHAIDAFCRLFEKMRPATLDDGMRRLLARITSQVNRMDTIIEGLLGLSRSGRSHMSRRRVDVTTLASHVVEQFRVRTPARNVAVDIAEGLEAFADESLLAMALEHLVSNAWKFTRLRPEARICIDATQEAGQTVFHISDNGIGFEMCAAEKLFTPFVRLHQNPEFDGHGIGLATAKRIIERHGGNIWAESRAGEGATFHFTLSLAPH